MIMEIRRDNYFSLEANQKFMSNSQYKKFCDCEAQTMASISGEWKEKSTNPMIQGKYVHAYYEGNGAIDRFKTENPSIVKNNGDFYATLKIDDLNNVIRVINEDELFLRSLEGQKEVIFTASLFGMDWKILIDSYNPSEQRFTDLKILKSLSDTFWNQKAQCRENVFEFYGYFTQIAIYAEVERIASGRQEGEYLEPFIAVATKEKYPDKEIISFGSEELSYQEFITTQLQYVESNMERIREVKTGILPPNRCDKCDYCKSTKQLTETKHYSFYNFY